MPSRVFFVGCGAGDPRLLTLRAAEILPRLDVALYDANVHADVLARLSPACERRPCKPGEDMEAQLFAATREDKVVGRLYSGDPLLSPTGEKEIRGIARAHVPFEVAPGVPVLPALGAYAGIPPFRSSDASPSIALCAVEPGHESLQDWSRLAHATDTLCVLTDASCIPEIVRSLVFYERAPHTPAAIVSGLATPAQYVITCTLQEMPARVAAGVRGRVVLAVGESVALRESMRWFDARPLFGKRVLVTRAREQAAGAAALLRERGAEPVVVPTIEPRPPVDPAPLRDAIARLSSWDFVAFTSQNGVAFAFDELARQKKDARAFGGAKVAAIGPATAQSLRERGIVPDLVAKDYTGEGLAEEMLTVAKPGARVLVLRAKQAREALPDALRAAGCVVDVVPAYETHAAGRDAVGPLAADLEHGRIDAVLFTSSSTVTNLVDALGPNARALLSRTTLASIGAITTKTAEEAGLTVAVTARASTVPGLVGALEEHFANKTGDLTRRAPGGDSRSPG